MKHAVAGEVCTTGICPFKCKYCYIPKTPEMKKVHERIVKRLESKEYISLLEKLYEDRLTNLSIWGTEPTLTLPIIEKDLELLATKFPKLEEISFSTSMMSRPDTLVSFTKAVAQLKRSIKLKIQVSVDGPAFITDVNRMPGAAENIPLNFLQVVSELQEISFGTSCVEFRWKPTLSIDNIRLMVESPDKIDEFFQYFKDLNEKFRQTNKNRGVLLVFQSYNPTVAVPCKYTSEDGKVFAEFLKLVHAKGEDTSYAPRLHRLFALQWELAKRFVFSCSGGDSSYGLDEHVHICHRTFYFDDEEYIKSVLATDMENWDVSNFKRGTLNFLKKWYMVDPNNELEMTRFAYVMRGYHDFWRFQLSYIMAVLKELVAAGQASPAYNNEDLALLFALFQNSAMSCPMENLLNTGVVHFQVVSLIRLFANGAFEELVKKVRP